MLYPPTHIATCGAYPDCDESLVFHCGRCGKNSTHQFDYDTIEDADENLFFPSETAHLYAECKYCKHSHVQAQKPSKTRSYHDYMDLDDIDYGDINIAEINFEAILADDSDDYDEDGVKTARTYAETAHPKDCPKTCRLYIFSPYFVCWACGRRPNVLAMYEPPLENHCGCGYVGDSSCVRGWSVRQMRPMVERKSRKGSAGNRWEVGKVGEEKESVDADEVEVTREMGRVFWY